MSKNWSHKLLPAHVVLHSQLYPRVNITCWVRNADTFGCAACSATKSNNRFGPRQSHARFLHQCAEHGRGRAQLRQKAQSAAPYLTFHRGYRELCATRTATLARAQKVCSGSSSGASRLLAAATDRSLSGHGALRHFAGAAHCCSRLSLSQAIPFTRRTLTQSRRVQFRKVSRCFLGPCV